MLDRTSKGSVIAVNAFIAAHLAFIVMNPAGGTLAYFLTRTSKYSWGEFQVSGIQYLTKLSVISIAVQALTVWICIAAGRRIVSAIPAYVIFLLFAVAWFFSYIPQTEMYGIDIRFTQQHVANYVIAMAPLLLFSWISIFIFQAKIVSIVTTGQGTSRAFLLFIILYTAINFSVFSIILFQPEWSEYFRFYSAFVNQGRGG